jgi:hypothetical protein
MEFGDLFSFDKKVVPNIIKPIYWIGLFVLPILGIVYFLSAFGKLFTESFFGGLWDMGAAIFWVVVGVLGLRILTELTIAIFDIHEKISPTNPTQT